MLMLEEALQLRPCSVGLLDSLERLACPVLRLYRPQHLLRSSSQSDGGADNHPSRCVVVAIADKDMR